MTGRRKEKKKISGNEVVTEEEVTKEFTPFPRESDLRKFYLFFISHIFLQQKIIRASFDAMFLVNLYLSLYT